MDEKTFPGDLPPYDQLNVNQKDFLTEHYKRCQAFWIHWTSTIWSIPTVISTINIGAYIAIFGLENSISSPYKAVILLLLVFLNIALTIGVYRHSYMQHKFGDQMIAIEKYYKIPIITLNKFSGSCVYVILMCLVTIISISFLLCHFICGV
jgi:hypothetical protein